MIHVVNRHNVAASLAVVALAAFAGWAGLAHATGTGSHGLSRVEESNVSMQDEVRIKTKGTSRVIVAHITVEPRGHTAWHYHPGPHFVSVRSGTVQVYEKDCSFRTYATGEGFFDPGPTKHPHIHTLLNPSSTESAEVVITDVREDDPRLTVAADPPPGPCFS